MVFDFIERRGGGTVFKWGLCILLLVLIALMGVKCSSQMHYVFDGVPLTFKSANAHTAVMVDQSGHEAKLTSAPDQFMGSNTVTYQNRTMQYHVNMEASDNIIYQFSDGSQVMRPYVTVFFEYSDANTPGDGLTPLQREEMNLIHKLEAYQRDGNPVWNHVRWGLFALIPLLIGLAMLCVPEKVWQLQNRYTVRGGEPTEWAILSNQLCGVFLLLLAFAIPFLQ